MKIQYSLFLFVIFSISSLYGQDDLDEIFGNEATKPSAYIGSNFVAILAGVPNIEADVRLKDSKLLIQAGFGVMPLGFRLRLEDLPLAITHIKKGRMIHAGVAYRVLKAGYYGEGGFYIGPKMEFLWHKYSDHEEFEGYEGFMKNSDPGYTIDEEDGIMYVDRLEQNYGVLIHYIREIGPKWSVLYGVSLGVNYTTHRYDSDNSVGVTWSIPEPEGRNPHYFHKFNTYVRINYGIRYRIF